VGLSVEKKGNFRKTALWQSAAQMEIAFHANGRNSVVLHAGFYCSSDSLKAQFTLSGNKALPSRFAGKDGGFFDAPCAGCRPKPAPPVK
jgi:hypothetical protein